MVNHYCLVFCSRTWTLNKLDLGLFGLELRTLRLSSLVLVGLGLGTLGLLGVELELKTCTGIQDSGRKFNLPGLGLGDLDSYKTSDGLNMDQTYLGGL